MDIGYLLKFEVQKDLDDWRKLKGLIESQGHFLGEEEKRVTREFGGFLEAHGVERIIDAHTHSFLYGHFREPRPIEGSLSPFFPARVIPNSPMGFVSLVCDEIYQKGAGTPFDIVSFGLAVYHTDVREQNRYVLSAARKHGNVVPFALTPPSFSEAELRSLVNAGFRGFKPYSLLADLGARNSSEFKKAYEDLLLSQWLTQPILHVAEETGVPVMLHISPQKDAAYGEAKRIISSYPKVKFILAHLGVCSTPELFDRYVCQYSKFRNVFLETSKIQDPQFLAHAFRRFEKGQLIYGSDLPYTLVRENAVALRESQSIQLPQEEWAEITSIATNAPPLVKKGSRHKITAFRSVRATTPRTGMVEQLAAIQAACQNLVAKKEFTPKEMSGFLQAFFYGSAKRLLHI